MNRKIAEAIINFANENNLDCMKDYSGRGIYGKKCIGIICDYKDILKVLGDIIVHLKDEELIASTFADLNNKINSLYAEIAELKE